MKKIHIIHSFSFVLILLFMSSCSEIIDIDFKSMDTQLVVEANVSNISQSQVKITKTIPFDENNVFPAVEGVSVKISDEQGNTELLLESSPGIYSSTNLMGVEGRKYTLDITLGSRDLKSSCVLPKKIAFDKLEVTETDDIFSFGLKDDGNQKYKVKVFFKDPKEEKNFYRFVEYVNDKIIKTYLISDYLREGFNVEKVLLYNKRSVKKGDVLKIEMQCIDEAVYEFYNSLPGLKTSGRPTSTPANPYSNITGDVLGYFSAHTSEFREYIIPK